MSRLSNRIAGVTGAAGGIGRGITLKFAAEGTRVGVLDLVDGGLGDKGEQPQNEKE